MARPGRRAPDAVALLRDIEAAPWKHGFFAALRRVEQAYPHKARLGESLRVQDDPVRLGQSPSVRFEPSTLTHLEAPALRRPARLAVAFLGLFGPQGPLPLHLTEYARDRMLRSGDRTFAAFADVFHHRVLSLFYRAWAHSKPTVHFDRPERDAFQRWLGATHGFCEPSFRGLDAMPDLAKLHYAGRLAAPQRNAEGLEAIVSDFLSLPARVVAYVGEWLHIPPRDQWRLGQDTPCSGLGEGLVLGDRTWTRQHRFTLVLGPVNLSAYRSLLPGASSATRLAAIVRNYVGYEFDWGVNVLLRRDEVPEAALDGEAQLGLTTWLGERPVDTDADELLVDAREIEAAEQTHE